MIDKPSVYRMILRYINMNSQAISGTVSVSPEDTNNIDTEQKFQVRGDCLMELYPFRYQLIMCVGVMENLLIRFCLNLRERLRLQRWPEYWAIIHLR